MELAIKKRLAGLAAAGVLALAMAPAAALGDPGDLTADTTITVTNIDAGDTAAYYQVVGQNASTNAWETKAPFTNMGLADLPGNASIKAENPTWTDIDYILDGITAEEAGVIAAKASGAGTAMSGSGTTFTASVGTGMYLVLAKPADNNKDVVYKPMFVSADYSQASPNTNELNAADSELATAVAKKSPLELTKTAAQYDDGTDVDSRGVAIGDKVRFTVETNIPSYTTNFTDPVYKLTDVMSQGLSYQTGSAQVTVAGYTVQQGTDYTVTGESATGYTVQFTKSFLNKVAGNPKLTVVYTATITSDAAKQVNEMDNTVTLNFSNEPNDTTGKGELKDKTRHYTFDIDSDVFGGTYSDGSTEFTGKTKEIEKIWVDANGNVDDSVKTTNYPGSLNPLEGAKFELRAGTNTSANALKFTNGKLDPNGSTVLTSASDGSITMKGLDAGTYYLVETAAPLGYSFDPSKAYTITITPTFTTDDDGNDILASYEVDIDGKKSIYNVGTNGTVPVELTETGATVNPNIDNDTTLIKNQKLGILPATGGSGILFYVFIGAAIMAIAVVLARRNRKDSVISNRAMA